MKIPELIASVDDLLFEAEHNGAEIFVVGEVVPVFGAVKVSLVRLLFHRRQFERSTPLELLLNGRLPPVQVADFRQTDAAHLQRGPIQKQEKLQASAWNTPQRGGTFWTKIFLKFFTKIQNKMKINSIKSNSLFWQSPTGT